jgi:hypothetical protein
MRSFTKNVLRVLQDTVEELRKRKVIFGEKMY